MSTKEATAARKVDRILNKLQRNGYIRLLDGTVHHQSEALKADIGFLRSALKDRRSTPPSSFPFARVVAPTDQQARSGGDQRGLRRS